MNNRMIWRRGIYITYRNRFFTMTIPFLKIYEYFKYRRLYTAGYKLDFIIELLTSSVVGLLYFTEKHTFGVLGKGHSLQERIDFDYGNSYFNWFAQYGYGHGHPISYVSAFLFIIFFFKPVIDWFVGKFTKYRFINLIEMIWAKRRKKYLYKIRAVRKELGKKKYLKLIRVTNAEYHSFW